MKQHRHNMDTVEYAVTLINSKNDIVTMSGRDAAGLKIGLKKAYKVIREAIEDYKENLAEVESEVVARFIKTAIERLDNILRGEN